MMNKPELRKKFDELSDKIREWLTSERATYVIIDINEKLGLAGSLIKIIPDTILRLVTKDIEPGEFINILAEELDMDFNNAKNIAQEIEEKILRPIEGPLRREADVDVKLIYFAKPRSIVSQPPTQPIQTPVTISHPEQGEGSLRGSSSPSASQNDVSRPIPIRVEPPVRQIPTPPPIPQSRPTFQPIRPPVIRLPINFPKDSETNS